MMYKHKCQFCGADYETEFENAFDICPTCSDTKEGKKYINCRHRARYLKGKMDYYTEHYNMMLNKIKVAENAMYGALSATSADGGIQ